MYLKKSMKENTSLVGRTNIYEILPKYMQNLTYAPVSLSAINKSVLIFETFLNVSNEIEALLLSKL
jgi:hypothetical protein